jgi:hypothetical protein
MRARSLASPSRAKAEAEARRGAAGRPAGLAVRCGAHVMCRCGAT